MTSVLLYRNRVSAREAFEGLELGEGKLSRPVLRGLGDRKVARLLGEVVAVSRASVWRVLKQAGLLSRWKGEPSRKGTGFEQPLQAHQLSRGP